MGDVGHGACRQTRHCPEKSPLRCPRQTLDKSLAQPITPSGLGPSRSAAVFPSRLPTAHTPKPLPHLALSHFLCAHEQRDDVPVHRRLLRERLCVYQSRRPLPVPDRSVSASGKKQLDNARVPRIGGENQRGLFLRGGREGGIKSVASSPRYLACRPLDADKL
jgi:hypothetical protein